MLVFVLQESMKCLCKYEYFVGDLHFLLTDVLLGYEYWSLQWHYWDEAMMNFETWLTLLPLVPHICINESGFIGSDNGLLPIRHQVTI